MKFSHLLFIGALLTASLVAVPARAEACTLIDAYPSAPTRVYGETIETEMTYQWNCGGSIYTVVVTTIRYSDSSKPATWTAVQTGPNGEEIKWGSGSSGVVAPWKVSNDETPTGESYEQPSS